MGTQRELLLEIVERTLTQLGARPPYPPRDGRCPAARRGPRGPFLLPRRP